MYKGIYKNNNFSIGEVFYAPDIQNQFNLHSLPM